MGRLFDAVSSLLCLRHATNYEGQAAIELEQIADRDCQQRYVFDVSDDGSIIRAQNVIRAAVEDIRDGVPPGIISAKFHLAVADLIAMVSRGVREERKLNRVALSGGVFQNVFLLRATRKLLRNDGFEVITHSRVPANDGDAVSVESNFPNNNNRDADAAATQCFCRSTSTSAKTDADAGSSSRRQSLSRSPTGQVQRPKIPHDSKRRRSRPHAVPCLAAEKYRTEHDLNVYLDEKR